jgi:hypothetical protein
MNNTDLGLWKSDEAKAMLREAIELVELDLIETDPAFIAAQELAETGDWDGDPGEDIASPTCWCGWDYRWCPSCGRDEAACPSSGRGDTSCPWSGHGEAA